MRAAWRTLPAPLLALLAAVLLLGVSWALLVPPFQAPDEQSHAGYVQSLVAGPGLPGKQDRPLFSTEQLAAQDAVNSDQTAANLLARPQWSAAAWQRWQRYDARLPDAARSDGGGPNPASSNPPLFYLYDALPYLAAAGGDSFARLLAMRLASVLWLLVTVAAAWLLAGELFGRDRLLQLVTAAVAGLTPMVVFISAQVGPDGMLYALWSLAFWLGARVLRRGTTPTSAIALLGVTGAALVTKATSYALLPAVLLVIGTSLWQLRATQAPAAVDNDRPRGKRSRSAWVVLAALAAFAVPFATWVAVAKLADHPVAAQVSGVSTADASSNTSLGELLSYAWQYYLPRLPFMTHVNLSGGGYPAYHVWIQQGWGTFGWLEVRFPDVVYKLFAAITAGVAVAAGARLAVTWRKLDRSVALFLALAAATLLAGLHWTDYHQVRSGAGAFMQGRYLFPLISLAGLAVAQALTWARGSTRRIAAGAVLGGLFALQVASLGLVATRFYA